MKTIAKATIILSILFLTAQTASAFGAFEWHNNRQENPYVADSGWKLAQEFTVGKNGPSESHSCDALALHLSLSELGDGDGDTTVQLRSGGSPTGALMDTGTIADSSYDGDKWYYVEMDDGDSLTSGNHYTIVVDFPSGHYYGWVSSEFDENTYSGNDDWEYNNYGSGWQWYCHRTDWNPAQYHNYQFMVLTDYGETNLTGAVESIEETTASFNFNRFNDNGNTSYTTSPASTSPYKSDIGLWYGTTSPVTEVNKEGNITGDTSQPIDTSLSTKSLSSLTVGQYYYIQPWIKEETGAFRTGDTTYTFLTKPNPPTSLSVTGRNSTNITLSWSNSTTGVTNQTTLIVYKTGSYPSSPTDGTIGYNGTAESTTITGLESDTEYKFSAFTYINASGSPYYWWFSDTYDTLTSSTVSGNFNITFKWECNHTLIDNTTTDFQNSTLWAETYYGKQVYYNNSLTENPMSFDITDDFNIFYFDYNNSGQIRSIIPASTPDSSNITFFVCCYDKYTTGYNYSDSQIFYTISFDDRTPDSRFITSNQSEVHLYKYNSTGQYFVHQDYLDAQDKIGVYLHYGERYFIGMTCPTLSIPFIQYIDTDINTNKEIKIIPKQDIIYNIFDFININTSYDDGLWFNYTDISFSTNYVNISYYNTTSTGTSTLVHQYNFSTDTEDYFWADANESYTYTITVIINNSILNTESTYTFLVLGSIGEGTITNTDWINTKWNTVLTIPFNITITQFVSFIISFIILISVGIKNSSAGFLLAGASLILLNAIIFFENSITTVASVVLGIVFIVLGLLFMRGEIKENGR